MPLLNIGTLLISLFLVLSISISALVWGTHWFTYPSQEERTKGIVVKSFGDDCNFWNVIHMYKAHTREMGISLGEVRPLKGAAIGGISSCIILLGVFALLIGLGTGYRFWANVSTWIYSVSLIIVITVFFPDLFMKFSGLKGRIFGLEIPSDAPLSLIWWGLLISLYGTAVLLKQSVGINAVEFIIRKGILPQFTSAGVVGFPLVWFGLIAGLSALMLTNPSPYFHTWLIFSCSWLIGALSCCFLGLFFL